MSGFELDEKFREREKSRIFQPAISRPDGDRRVLPDLPGFQSEFAECPRLDNKVQRPLPPSLFYPRGVSFSPTFFYFGAALESPSKTFVREFEGSWDHYCFLMRTKIVSWKGQYYDLVDLQVEWNECTLQPLWQQECTIELHLFGFQPSRKDTYLSVLDLPTRTKAGLRRLSPDRQIIEWISAQ